MADRSAVLKKSFPVIWYNLGWFGAIYAGKWGISAWSLVFPAILLIFLLSTKALSVALILRLLVLALAGMAFDTLMSTLGFVVYIPSDSMVLPLWMISIWLLFVMIFPILEGLFRGRMILAAVLGGIFGPLSYLSGKPLEVIEFSGTAAVICYVVFWTIYFPGALYVVGKVRTPGT